MEAKVSIGSNWPMLLSIRACRRAAHSSIRSLGIPAATAFAIPPISSTFTEHMNLDFARGIHKNLHFTVSKKISIPGGWTIN